MRQIGLLAGCISYALNHNFSQLPRVHALARRLETGLRGLGVHILGAGTCMVCLLFSLFWTFILTTVTQVFFDPTPLGFEVEELEERAAMLPEPMKITTLRLVVHIQTEDQAIDDLLTLIKVIAEEKKTAGFVGPPIVEGKSSAAQDIYRENNKRFKSQSQ